MHALEVPVKRRVHSRFVWKNITPDTNMGASSCTVSRYLMGVVPHWQMDFDAGAGVSPPAAIWPGVVLVARYGAPDRRPHLAAERSFVGI